ncbi:ABC transporter ATP-binding protein [Roseburia faecis]|jgi:putative ABC transport system ATP-binding protein|uniref:ABC transporter ATP-binding protein n=1 Tax=Roseburia faecis TaxID=301302 RepID=UPI0018A114B4|nr:ABC transporter ATP-binding protein [Roseburia faecis]
MELFLKNVSKIYRNGENVTYALTQVDLEIKQRKFVAITGDSGSGKTTLLKLIGGIEKASEGEIWLDKTNITNLTSEQRVIYRRENIGFIFQDFNLVEFLNVQDNILLPISLVNGDINKEKYTYLLETLRISKLVGKYPNTLSGGEKQRVAIARALLMQPRLILADEPTGNLDSRNTEEVFCLLKRLSEEFEQTTIMITHDLKLADRCDRVLTMKDGRLYD